MVGDAESGKRARGGRPAARREHNDNALDIWRRAHGLTYGECGALYGVAWSACFYHCLPMEDPRRTIPSAEAMPRIYAMSAGALEPRDFYRLPKLVPGAAPTPEEASP
jgi:hypothetical protein